MRRAPQMHSGSTERTSEGWPYTKKTSRRAGPPEGGRHAGRKKTAPLSRGAVFGWSAGPKLLASQAGRGLRRERDAGTFDGAATAGLRGLGRRCCQVGTADRNRDIFAFTDEVKMIFGGFPVDADHVTKTNLLGGEKIGHR